MHAYLLLSSSSENIQNHIFEIAPKARVVAFSINKISDVKELVERTNIGFGEKTVFHLTGIEDSSIEAQNALLKRLEEPQENLIFVLSASEDSKILPTILSRCQTIRLKPDTGANTASQSLGTDFVKMNPSERLSAIGKFSKREDALSFLFDLVESLRVAVRQDLTLSEALRHANEAHARIKANANPTLQLTRMAVNIGHAKE